MEAGSRMSMSDKFLFDTSFEPEDMDGSVMPGQKPAKPKFGEADLEKARTEGFAAGKESGRQEAMQSIEQQISQTLSAISEQLTGLSQAQVQASERQTRGAVEAALTVVRKMFPRLAGRHGLTEIESVVCDCLERLRTEPRIVIRVADSLLDQVEQRVIQLAAGAGFDGKIVFLSQEGLQPGDIRVEWADGGAERDSDRLWHEIDQIITRTIGPMQPAADAAEPAPVPASTDKTAPEPAPSGPVADGAVVSA
jgi:flagellar assembly protein FliH